jgi:hypothetical protein
MQILLVLLGGVVAALVGAAVAWRTNNRDREQRTADLEHEIDQRQRELDKEIEQRQRELDKEIEQRKDELAQENERFDRGHEYQTRAALRSTYAALLVAQRRAREAWIQLATAGGKACNQSLAASADMLHAEFIEMYHQLNLDSTETMWKDAQSLREVLEDLREDALLGDRNKCNDLGETARLARQNLEGSFRARLGYEPHQTKNDLGKYNK